VIRDCHCAQAKHQHGTELAYCSDACRCQPCRDAHAAGARRRRRTAAYGRNMPKSVPNAGTRRRVEALMCLGWSMRVISRRLGWHEDRLAVMLAGYDGVSPQNAERIAALYEQLWNAHPPQATKGDRMSVSRTIALAQRRGFRPPMAWDDTELDAPPRVLPHGTHAAFNRHRSHGHKPCARCLRAEHAYQARRMRRMRAQTRDESAA
jgi:hypothetical protein